MADSPIGSGVGDLTPPPTDQTVADGPGMPVSGLPIVLIVLAGIAAAATVASDRRRRHR